MPLMQCRGMMVLDNPPRRERKRDRSGEGDRTTKTITMKIRQVLKNLELAHLDKLTSDQKDVYSQWLKDDAGCDLVQFFDDSLDDKTEALLWELQYATQATYELQELQRLAKIGEAAKTMAALLLGE